MFTYAYFNGFFVAKGRLIEHHFFCYNEPIVAFAKKKLFPVKLK